MLLKDLNPCLTPYCAEKKSKVSRQCSFEFLQNPIRKCLSYDMHSMQPCKENADRMDISCRSLRQWAMSLLLTQAYLRAIRKLAMNLASALVWGSYPIVQTFTRTPAQEAQWPDQLAGQMKAKEHTESKPNKDISSILPVILFSWGINVINWCFLVLFFLMMIMDYSIIVAISPGCKCCCLSTWIRGAKPYMCEWKNML
jgi:hypothetical protein